VSSDALSLPEAVAGCMQQKHRLTGPVCVADAFADAAEQEENTAGVDYVHIRVQQRNGKKSLTTVQVIEACFSPGVVHDACCLLSALGCRCRDSRSRMITRRS